MLPKHVSSSALGLFALVLANCRANETGVVSPKPKTSAANAAMTPQEIATHFADGSWRASALVDPKRGLVRYWTETSDRDDNVRPTIKTHLCGTDLTAALPELDLAIESAAKRASQEDPPGIRCTASECNFNIAGEYEPTHTAVFAAANQPFALVAYLEMQQYSPDAQRHQREILDWSDLEIQRSCP